MGAIIHNLTVEEQNKRTAALQSAAKKGQANWTSAGQSPKRAYYQRQGEIKNNAGQRCQQIRETIIMPDGQTGTSVKLVCMS